MSQLSLSFFGSGRILGPRGDEIILRGRKEFALLAYLAHEPENAHRREFLGGLLWPEMGAGEFRNNLRVTLSRLKNGLLQGGVDPLLIERQTVQFDLSPKVEIDTNRFQQLVNEIDSHPHAELSSCADCFPKLVQAVGLYQGEFLRGFHVDDSYTFEDWLTIQREHFHLRAIGLLSALEAAYLAQSDTRAAIDTVRRRLTLDPLQEDAHRQLMTLMVGNGERHSALVQYESCRRVLDQELSVPPSPETVRLYEQIRNGEVPESVLEWRGGTRAIVEEKIVEEEVQTAPEPASAPSSPASTAPRSHKVLTHLDPLPNQKLFGIDTSFGQLLSVLRKNDRPWLVSIDGIGGIGKTSLARDLVQTLVEMNDGAEDSTPNGATSGGNIVFDAFGWVSAKQEEFHADLGIQSTERPALDADLLIDSLLEQLADQSFRGQSTEEKQQALAQLLNQRPTMVVVDNLETVADYQALIPLLSQLANPSKFLITSRLSLQRYPDVFSQSLQELNQTDALALLRHEAAIRGVQVLLSASDDQLAQIYAVVGGHPLALNLVLGQLRFLPLPQVLVSLQEARGREVDQLYTYIYWQAWEMLEDATRQLLLAMPIIYNGTFTELSAASMLELDELQAALTQLIGLSLVQVGGDLLEPRYRLHRLTETFLMNEVLKWQSP